MFETLELSPAFKNSITAAIRKGSLSHALILEGSDEKTRLSAAKEIASAIFCKSDIRPCGSCDKCRKVNSSSHPDLHILQKDAKSSMIKVDAVRELKKKALVFPNDGDKSVFIIDGAEFMNPQAQNALLKIFEEPAPHLIFILCCQTKSSLLDTVISRATVYSLGSEAASEKIRSEKEQKADSLASELLKALIEENEVEFLKKIAVLQKDKELFRLCLESIRRILRDSLVLLNGGSEMLTDYSETVKKLSSRLTARKILQLYTAAQELYESSKANANHNLLLTRFSAVFYSIKSN